MSGVGGNPVASVKMQDFDLVAGGKINLTPGVTSLILDSIGPNTQVNLRTLPPAPSYRTLPANPGNTAGRPEWALRRGGVVQHDTTTSAATGTVTGANIDHGHRGHRHGHDDRHQLQRTGTTTVGTGGNS